MKKTAFRKDAQSLCGQYGIDAKDAIVDFRKETGVKNNTNWDSFKEFINDNKSSLRKRFDNTPVYQDQDCACDNSWDNWCREEFPEEWYTD